MAYLMKNIYKPIGFPMGFPMVFPTMVLGDAPERLGTAVGSRAGAPVGRWRWLV